MSLGCGRPQRHDDLISGNSKRTQNGRIRNKTRNIDVFLQTGILQDPLRPVTHGTVWNYVRHENPIRLDKTCFRTVLVIMHHDGWYTQCFAGKDLRSGAMRESKARAKPGGRRNQLRGAKAVTKHFEHFVFAVVSANNFAWQFEELNQLAHLVDVSCGQVNRDVPFLQFFDDGDKKGHMRRIIDIDPHPSSLHVLGKHRRSDWVFRLLILIRHGGSGGKRAVVKIWIKTRCFGEHLIYRADLARRVASTKTSMLTNSHELTLLPKDSIRFGGGMKLPSYSGRVRKSGNELIGSVAAQDCAWGLRQDLKIKPERPSASVVQVETHHIVKVHTAAAFHLPQPGDSGFDLKNAAAVPEIVFFVLVGKRWPWTHDGHVAFQNINKLRQLIQAGPAKYSP